MLPGSFSLEHADLAPGPVVVRTTVAVADAGARWGEALERRIHAALRGAGLLGAIKGYQIETGGKRLRGLLPVLVCHNLGGDPERALPLGAGLEIVHNATLVHDDLQDGDRERRGRPTIWRRFGPAQAINAGDALIFDGLAAIARAPAGARALPIVLDALGRVVEGQAMDIQARLPAGHPDRLARTVANAQATARGKTGALLGACFAAGAIAAGARDELVERAAGHGEALGLLFQVVDDLLDLVGDKGRAGGRDLRAGGPSFPLAWAEERASAADRSALRAILRRGEPARVDEAIALLDRCGALRGTAAWLEDASAEALADPLADLAPGLVERILAPVAHALRRSR